MFNAMSRRALADARAVITGASSGIGRALALALARAGTKLLLTARRESRLAQLAAEIASPADGVDWLAGDIASAPHRAALIARLGQRFGGLDLLVNCAGIGGMGRFRDAPPERLREIFEVNFFAPVELIRTALPLLEQGRRPIIVNIGSVLGHCAVPGKSEYCASKFALHGFSDALRAELAPHGIDVLLVSPSTTATDFFEEAATRSTQRVPVSRFAMRPERVARKTLSAIQTGRQEIVLSAGGRFLVWADRLFPAWTNRLLSRFG